MLLPAYFSFSLNHIIRYNLTFADHFVSRTPTPFVLRVYTRTLPEVRFTRRLPWLRDPELSPSASLFHGPSEATRRTWRYHRSRNLGTRPSRRLHDKTRHGCTQCKAWKVKVRLHLS